MVIETISGRFVDLLNPSPEDFDINDIAYSLSQQCRFNGHCRGFYSVAEHSWLVSRTLHNFPREVRLAGLLHDATEAYMSDLPSPVKALFPEYREFEENLMEKIFNKYGLEYPLHPAVKHADKVMLATEAHYLMNSQGKGGFWGGELPQPAHGFRPIGMDSRTACKNFLEKFQELTSKENKNERAT